MLRKARGQVPAVDLPESPQKFSQNPPREAACIHPLRPSAGQPSGDTFCSASSIAQTVPHPIHFPV